MRESFKHGAGQTESTSFAGANGKSAQGATPATPAGNKPAGTMPPGASDESSAAHAVEQMFDEIAPRYDLLNHTLSMNVDRLWWRRTARTFRHILQRSDARIL